MVGTIAEAVSRIISVEEYLNTSYRPDRELVDGRLEEKPMTTMLHSYVQGLLSQWFLNHKKQWGILAMSEPRTRVQEERFRLPDVAVVLSGTKMRNAPMEKPPLIAIEIMSPEDAFTTLRRRASDFARMGTKHVWLIDPEDRFVYIFDGVDWRTTETLQVPESPIHLDVGWLWSQIDEEL